jgi:hypothetical protein
MAQKWQMCNCGIRQISFFHPDKPFASITPAEYVKSKGGTPGKWSDDEIQQVIPYILADGWEPYAVYGSEHYLFKKPLD